MLLLLLACGARRDPLEAERAMLAALAESPPPESWSPHAGILLGEALPAALVSRVGTTPYQQMIAGPMGVQGLVSITPQTPTLSFAASSACDACIAATLDWAGVLDLEVGGVPVALEIGWASQATAPLTLQLEEVAEGPRVVHVAAAEAPDVTFWLDGMGEPWDFLVGTALQNYLLTPRVSDALSASVPLFALEGRAGGLVHDLRVSGEPTPRVELLFYILEGVALPEVTADTDTLEVQVPTRNLLGVMWSLALAEDPVNGFVVEPTTLQVTGDALSLGLKLWKVGKRPTWREYVMKGRLVLEGGEIALQVDESFEIDKEGWEGRLIGPLVKATVNRYLRKGLSLSVPSRVEDAAGTGSLSIEIVEIFGGDEVVRIRGEVR